jgi:CRP-like cAMP-binding protein
MEFPVPEAYDIAPLGLKETSEILVLLGQCADIEPRRYREGEFLMTEGEESSDLFIVLDGACVVERPGPTPGASPSILATLTAEPENPAIFGEMAYFGTQHRSASVRSVGNTYTLCLHPHHIEIIVEGFPALRKLIFRQFTQRLLEANQSLMEMHARFAMAPERRMASPGEVLFTAGEPARTLFQLVVGGIRLETAGQVEIVTAEGLPQGFLDLEVFLTQGAHRTTATVESMAFLVAVDAAHREAVVRTCPELILDLLQRRNP